MKAKILLLLFAVLTLFSCKTDRDDDNNTPPIPAEKRYLSSVTDQDGKTVVSVEYYADKKIKKYNLDITNISFRYIYDNNGRVSSQILSSPNANMACNYTYDANGKISSFAYDDEGETKNIPVTYNQAENSYTYTSLLGAIKVFIDAEGNCTKFINENTSFYFFYENEKSGPLRNGGNMSLTNYISYLPMFLYQSQVNTFSVPLEEVNTTGTITFTNEYDSENFLVKSKNTTVTSDDNGNPETSVTTYTYHYTEL